MRSFRNKFGRGWDAETTFEGAEDGKDGKEIDGKIGEEEEGLESLMDLISGAGKKGEKSKMKGRVVSADKRKDK